jgi:hypothetical protein
MRLIADGIVNPEVLRAVENILRQAPGRLTLKQLRTLTSTENPDDPRAPASVHVPWLHAGAKSPIDSIRKLARIELVRRGIMT